MLNMKKIVFFVPVLVLCIVSGAWSIPAEIRVVSDEWTDYTNADGTGLYWDILQLVYEPLGVSVVTDVAVYKDAQESFLAGKYDVFLGAYRFELKNVYYPKIAIDYDEVAAMFKKGRVEQWQREASLRGNLGWQKGYELDQYLAIQHRFREFDDFTQGLEWLIDDKIDFLLEDSVTINDFMKGRIIRIEDFEIRPVMKLFLFPVFSKTKKGKELLDIYEKRMPEVMKTGELEALFNKWKMDYPY